MRANRHARACYFSYDYFSYEVRSDSRQETREQRQTADQTRDHTAPENRRETETREERRETDETKYETKYTRGGDRTICICGRNLAGARTTFVILIYGV
jgi:hypothetical protein